jgi:hypothetical protein
MATSKSWCPWRGVPLCSCHRYRFGATSDDRGQHKRHREHMGVQWQAKVAERVDDVVASKNTDRRYVAASRLTAYAEYSPGVIMVIDTVQRGVIDAVAVPRSPDTRQCEPRRFRVLVTHYDTNSIPAVDVEQGTVASVFLSNWRTILNTSR